MTALSDRVEAASGGDRELVNELMHAMHDGEFGSVAEWNSLTAWEIELYRLRAVALLPIITRREREAAEAMRERCAGVAEEYPSLEYADIAVVRGIAKVIRSLI